LLTKYYLGDQIKKNEMGGACSVYRGHRGEMYIGFLWEDLKKIYLVIPRRRWEDNIKMDLQDLRWGGMEWTDVVQDRDRWRALVNAVMN
jgi:hypothetical protein